MTLQTFVRLCRAYRDLGDAVAEQLDDVLDGRMDDLNANALRLLHDWLRTVERVAWDDDELGGEVTQAVEDIEKAIQEAES
jgi:hypothetical protein